MDPVVRTYDSKKIAMSFTAPAGSAIISSRGLPDGDFLAITAPDTFEGVDGADGGHDRVNMNNGTYDVEITLKKTSPVNDELAAIFEADKLNNTGKGVLNIVDGNGTMYLKSQQAYIVKNTDLTLGKSMSTTTWVFKAPMALFNPGYNL